MKKSFAAVSSFALAIILAGCQTEQKDSGGVTVNSNPSLVTMDIDAADYNLMAKAIEESLAHSGKVTRTNVVSLGPVAVSLDGPYQMDPKTLQDKVQTISLKDGLIQ